MKKLSITLIILLLSVSLLFLCCNSDKDKNKSSNFENENVKYRVVRTKEIISDPQSKKENISHKESFYIYDKFNNLKIKHFTKTEDKEKEIRGSVKFKYDADDNLIKEDYFDSSNITKITMYEYDNKNRVIKESYSSMGIGAFDNGTVLYEYDKNGNMSKKEEFPASKPSVTTIFNYDKDNILRKAEYTTSEGESGIILYDCNDMNRITSETTKDNSGEVIKTIKYHYDEKGKLTKKETKINELIKIKTYHYETYSD